MQLNGWKEKCLHSFFCGDILIHSLPEWNSSLQKRVIAWDPNCARIYGIIWGGGGRECKQTWRKAKWNVSAELKQLKIAKRKVELREKKTWQCEAEGKRCACGNFTSRKTRRMHRETASEMASLWWSQNNRKENAVRAKVSTRELGSSWSYLCKKTQQLACLVIIQGARGCSTCPPNNPITECALSLIPGYHSFPKWAIWSLIRLF